MKKILKELPLVGIVLMPFAYLAYVWRELPNSVPLHWNINGEVDRYGNKLELLIIPFLLPLLSYLLFLIIPKIDPKSKLNNMGRKFQSIKILLVTFMSILALFIIYVAKNQSFFNSNYLILLIGILYIVFGNFFKTIRPNYFIGIRTPWTLENEEVWKKTHKLTGIIWFIAGFLIVILSLLIKQQINFIVFLIITLIISIVPIVFSYVAYKQK